MGKCSWNNPELISRQVQGHQQQTWPEKKHSVRKTLCALRYFIRYTDKKLKQHSYEVKVMKIRKVKFKPCLHRDKQVL